MKAGSLEVMQELIATEDGRAGLLDGSGGAPRLQVSTSEGQAEVPLKPEQAQILADLLSPQGGEIEIERRFLLRDPPPIEGCPSQRLRQGYLLVSKEASLRIREKGNGYKMTLKTGRGLARKELEMDLEGPQAEALWPLAGDRRIDKTRYLVDDGDRPIEVDIYHGRHEGLRVAEREFDSREAAAAWSPPAWMGLEITEDGRYTNAALALGHLPEDAGR